MFSVTEFYNENFCIATAGSGVTVLELKDGRSGKMIFYHIMPGIDVVYNKFTIKECIEPDFVPYSLNMLEINHCRRGRYGCTINTDKQIYLGEGEAEANLLGIKRGNPEFPLGFYEGIELLIDVPTAVSTLSELFPEAAMQTEHLFSYVSQHDMVVHINSQDKLDGIFCELYDLDPSVSHSYMKIKVIELLLTMQCVPMDEQTAPKKYFSKSDRQKVRAIHGEAVKNLDKKITLIQFSEKYEISITALKSCFRQIYGSPYYSYIKHYKMHKAAHYLEETTLSVTKIAGLLGYDNSSKFSAAFKSITGYTPSGYRNNNVRLEHLELFGVEMQ